MNRQLSAIRRNGRTPGKSAITIIVKREQFLLVLAWLLCVMTHRSSTSLSSESELWSRCGSSRGSRLFQVPQAHLQHWLRAFQGL